MKKKYMYELKISEDGIDEKMTKGADIFKVYGILLYLQKVMSKRIDKRFTGMKINGELK